VFALLQHTNHVGIFDERHSCWDSALVNFRNTIIIMTSNIGSQYNVEEPDEARTREGVMTTLRSHFPPEFLNRIDDIVIFHRLDKEHLAEIAEIQLRHVEKLLGLRDVTIALAQPVTDLSIEEGFNHTYGARPLKRVIQHRVVDPLASELFRGEVRDGVHIVVDAKDGESAFDVVVPAGATERQA
jgi:ATP-dependent Clp protease ATP-binding subunit ClpB